MTRRITVLFLCSTLAVAASAAQADPPASAPDAATVEAKSRFALGSQLYQLGKYREAIDEFKAAEAVRPDPAFDYDIATCYRKLGDLPNARIYLERTVREAGRDSRYRQQALLELGEIDATLSAHPATPPEAAQASRPAPASEPRNVSPFLPESGAPEPSGTGVAPVSYAPAWITGGAAAALLATGAIFGLLGSQHDSAVHDFASSPQAAQSDISAAQGDYLAANLLFAGATVTAGVAAYLFYREHREATTVTVAAGPGAAVVGVSGVLP